MVGGQQSTRSTAASGRLFRLADRAGLLRDPELAAGACAQTLAVRGVGPDMRDLDEATIAGSRINTATVRKQADLDGIVEACARHGIRAIDPWRDQVAHVGLDRAVRAVRDAGIELSGYCRGGMFTGRREPPR